MLGYDVVVVGAGLAGATAANLLADKGLKVLVIEKRKHIAGNCFDFKNSNNITIQRYGPHIFHTNDAKVWKFVNDFSAFHYYQHRVLSYVNGNYVPFPINIDTVNNIFGMNLDSTELSSFFAREVQASCFNLPVENFRDAVVSQVGERLYELFFKNYTFKQWQQEPERISPEVAQRIPVRHDKDGRYFKDRFQGIPQRGYTQLVEKMLDRENIALLLGVDYLAVKSQISAGLVIYTGKLDSFFDYKYGELGYRSVALHFADMDCEYYQSAPVINYPNDYEWTRITEFKYFLNEKSNKSTVLFEYPHEAGEPFYVTLTADNLQKKQCYLRDVKVLEQSGKYVFLGRLAEYKYYNMDQVIAAAMEKIQSWGEKYGI
ncbi:MAG TPA: UDP-galactopyranose mutase [Negativicutes bacterium]|jgi:UDP-galactopyranose mutase